MEDEGSDDDEVQYNALQTIARRFEERERADLVAFLEAERRFDDQKAIEVEIESARRDTPPCEPEAAHSPLETRPSMSGSRRSASRGRGSNGQRQSSRLEQQHHGDRIQEMTALRAEVSALENELVKALEEQKRLRAAKRRLERQLTEAEEKLRAAGSCQEDAKAEVEKWAEAKRAEIRKAQKKLDRERAEFAQAKRAPTGDKAVEAEIDALRATVERIKVAGEEKHDKSLSKQAALRAKIQAQDEKIKELEAAVERAERTQLEANKAVTRTKTTATHLEAAVDRDARAQFDASKSDRDDAGPIRREHRKTSDDTPPWRVVRDGIRERVFSDGKREVIYKNGTTKTVEGDLVIVNFANGDVKRTDTKTGRVVYFYADARTTHTTDPVDELEIFEFPNGQVERHKKDGSKDIHFPDGTRKFVDPDGRSQTRFPDGVVVVSDKSGQ